MAYLSSLIDKTISYKDNDRTVLFTRNEKSFYNAGPSKFKLF